MHPEIEWNEAESNSLADGNPYISPNAILEGVFARLGANCKKRSKYTTLAGLK